MDERLRRYAIGCMLLGAGMLVGDLLLWEYGAHTRGDVLFPVMLGLALLLPARVDRA